MSKTRISPVRGTKRVALLAATSFVLAACSGGSSAPSIEVSPGTRIESGLQSTRDNFAFPNFGARKTPEEFGTADVVTMFGDGPDVCASGSGESCKLVAEAAAWARMVNQACQAGHCEGFAVMSAARFMQGVTPYTAELANSGDVTHGIMRGFATQFIPSV